MVTKKILVTGGAGQIAYQLAFRIAAGELLGSQSPIELILLEKPEFLGALTGVFMELQDCAYPLLQNIIITDDPKVAFKDVDIAFLVGSKPRAQGQQRKDLLLENGAIFKEQGQYLDQLAKDTVKVLVVGNPCNTNCWIAYKSCKRLKDANFQAMTRLDENRIKGLLSNKLCISVGDLKNITVWGNHSSTLVPDLSHGFYHNKALYTLLDKNWIQENFCKQVQERGAEIIKIRGKSSAASAAQAARDAMKSWLGLSNGQWFSSVIYSQNNLFGLDDDLMFSFPLYTKQDQVFIQDIKIEDQWVLNKIKLSEVELKEERDMVFNLFKQ